MFSYEFTEVVKMSKGALSYNISYKIFMNINSPIISSVLHILN